jgi:threonine synthase
LTKRRGFTKNLEVGLFTEFYFISPLPVVQVVLSTAHPAKFSEAVTKALSTSQGFDFERDVLPPEFRGLLKEERRVVDVDELKELVKKVIESKVGLAGNGV